MDIVLTDFDGNELLINTISEGQTHQSECEQQGFLPVQICLDFRNAINSSPIFREDEKYLSKYNLCCAVMDRLDTCVEKLNRYGDYPDTEEDFLIFMMFSCMVKDAVERLLLELGISEPNANKNFFEQVYLESPVYNPDAEIPTDDRFFSYLRSLIFAHPFETSRAMFLRDKEKQYSPWVIVNSLLTDGDSVGVRVYTNQSEEILDIHFSFALLKNYILSKYNNLTLATDWANKEVEKAKRKWLQTKINRKNSAVDILREIDSILTSRYAICDDVRAFIEYLNFQLSDERNTVAVDKFKTAIIMCIPSLCDAVEMLDHERVERICDRVLKIPDKMHIMARYQLEKIFCYLDDGLCSAISNEDRYWGLTQAKHFTEAFAKKWVHIDTEMMSCIEIKLLVSTACYLERQEQEENK